MILQALTQYYEDLLRLGKINRPGWSKQKLNYSLLLSEEGELLQLLHLQQEVQRGNKTVLGPQEMWVPSPVKRSSGIRPNFLCDTSSYLLGVDGKGKADRSIDCFAASKALHLQLLKEVDSPIARAIVRFFEHWDPSQAASHPALQEDWEELLQGGNLTFSLDKQFAALDPAIADAWTRHYEDSSAEAEPIRCLVTGQTGTLARLHPSIKGVAGAQSSGASLVSFNDSAFCSFEHKQGANAPVSDSAAFAYTTALNTLLADRNRVSRVGDTTILCWAAGGESAYQDCFLMSIFNDSYTENDILNTLHHLSKGESIQWDDTRLSPDTRFYVLGLAPNAARLSVRFFWQNSFGALARNLERHYQRLEIIRPSFDKFPTLPIWRLVLETVRKASPGGRAPEPHPRLAGDLLLAVLNDTLYPATLLNGVELRIRAERKVSRGQAASLKAYYTKYLEQFQPDSPIKEALTVELNEQTNYLPYLLGRLFAVLEGLQQSANPGINTTIKDRYFNSASATPLLVFPILRNLAIKHLEKLKKMGENEKKLAFFYEKKIIELNGRTKVTFPARMSLAEQNYFQLGYYHETQRRYTAKTNKEEQ